MTLFCSEPTLSLNISLYINVIEKLIESKNRKWACGHISRNDI